MEQIGDDLYKELTHHFSIAQLIDISVPTTATSTGSTVRNQPAHLVIKILSLNAHH